MIIKSHIRGGYRNAAAYLKEQGQNEKTRLVEMSDPHAQNLDDAFKAMWAISNGTKVKKPLHHVSINPMKDERLTDKQVQRVCERLEERYGYEKGAHQRVIVEHIKDGRQHFHVIWNRVSLTTGKPHYPYMHKTQSKITAREMEAELGLKKPMSRRMKKAVPTRKSPLSHHRRYAHYLGIHSPAPQATRKRKGGKGDGLLGSGGGAASSASAFKTTKKETPQPLMLIKPTRGRFYEGPNRRRRNLWVPVERRDKYCR